MVTVGRSLRADWRFVVAVVSGGHFLSHFYLLSFPPLFPLLTAEFGLTNAQLGLAVSAMSVAALLQMPVGSLVDRVGATRVFVAGVAVTAAGVALVGLSESYPVILAAAGLSGIGQSAFHPADYAILEAVTDPAVEGRSFSVHTFSGFAGFAAAPLVVGTLGLTVGWQAALLAVGSVGVLYAAVAGLLLRSLDVARRDERDRAATRPADGDDEDGRDGEGVHDDADSRDDSAARGLREVLRPGILVMAAFFLAMAFGGKGVHTFTAVLAVESFGLSEAVGNATLTAFFAASAVGILVGGVLADTRNPRRVVVVAPAVAALGIWLTVSGLLDPGAVAFLGLFAAVGFIVGLAFPSRDRLVSAAAPTGSAGRSFGLVFTGGALGSLVSPVFLGAVIDATTARHAFALVGACYLAAAAVATTVGWLGGGPVGIPAASRGD